MERAEEEEELLEDLLDTDSGHREDAAESRVSRCMGKLRDMVERPHSGLPGKIFACLSVLFVTITAVNLSISTMPAMRKEEEAVSRSHFMFVCMLSVDLRNPSSNWLHTSHFTQYE